MIGIIGGSALGSPTLFSEGRDTFPVTPFGAPSGPVTLARRGDTEIAFVARHGPGHTVPPHRVNHKANLWALREAGADRIVTTSSVGSLKLAIRPGTFVVPDDYVAFWEIPTYFDQEVRHVTPVLDADLRASLVASVRKAKGRALPKGVYVQATGPRLETKAEIAFFRTVGDVLGMTIASEATLAAELGIPYAALCSVDNYCNGITKAPVTWETIAATQRKNASATEAVIAAALEVLG